MNDVRTHRGFLITRNASSPGYLSNPVFDSLFEHHRTHSMPQEDFGFITDVVTHAKGLLFAKGSNLLKDQLWNPSSQWVLSFVASTLDFVNGYPRTISVNNYSDLLEFHPALTTQFDASANRDKLRQWEEILNLPADQFLSLWLSQESGLFDLVSTLHLIAGELPAQWSEHPKPM